MSRFAVVIAFLLLLFCTAGPLSLRAAEADTATPAAASPPPSQRVGQPLLLRDVYLPGAEAKPKPRRDAKPPLVVRVIEVKPAKDGFRYDLEIQGLEPGRYNVSEFLEIGEATPTQAIPIEIVTPLAPGLIQPHASEPGALPKVGGYRAKMIGLGLLWLAGLVAILLWKKKQPAAADGTDAAPASLAERLRPLVREAASGQMDTADRARLERLLIGHWRERLPEIAALTPAEAMTRLRQHPEASPLLLALERWLHAPAGSGATIDLETLLAPYRNA